MKDLIILGAGGVGGFLAHNLKLFSEHYNLIGFLDDDPEKNDKEMFGSKVLGEISQIEKYNNEKLSVGFGIAFPSIKKIILDKLSHLDINFPSFISQNAWLAPNIQVGKGVIIYPCVSINYNCIIDDFAVLNMNCALGHDCKVGKYSSLAPGVNLAGYTKIGNCVEVGIGACSIQNINIGNNSIIGGQAIVTKNIPDNAVVVGNPGRIMKYNEAP